MFYGNQHIKSSWIKFKKFIKKTIVTAVVLDVIGWSLTGGYYYAKTSIKPEIVEAAPVSITVSNVTIPPVMQRIAQCESGNSQIKNGQVQIHINDNHTVDEGRYMINLTVWGSTATKMGYDLTKDTDNEAFALWLYANRGTSDWYSSASCWDK